MEPETAYDMHAALKELYERMEQMFRRDQAEANLFKGKMHYPDILIDRELLLILLLRTEKIMAQIDDLNAAIAAIGTELTSTATEVTALIADLKAGAPATDLTAPIAALAEIKTTLDTLAASVGAAITPVATG